MKRLVKWVAAQKERDQKFNDSLCLLRIRYIHDMNGLWATSGCIPSASDAVNFKIPMSSRVTTNP
jgi:hypothetical protein